MMEKIRLTASERESLIRLNVAYEILDSEGEHLARRFGVIPGGRRDLGMLKAKIKKLMEQVVGTIPDDQLKSYVNSLKMASYTVGIRKPGHMERDEKTYGMWLPFEVINALLAGCHDHCMMCPADKAERRACKLRKALETVPNDTPDRDDDDCPFYTLM